MIRILIVAFALCVAPAMPATAQSMTGNNLLKACTSGEYDPMMAICVSYIAGIRDTLDAVRSGGVHVFSDEDVSVPCIRKAVTNDQIRAVVVKWMNDNPKIRDFPAWTIIIFAMNDAFPCN